MDSISYFKRYEEKSHYSRDVIRSEFWTSLEVYIILYLHGSGSINKVVRRIVLPFIMKFEKSYLSQFFHHRNRFLPPIVKNITYLNETYQFKAILLNSKISVHKYKPCRLIGKIETIWTVFDFPMFLRYLGYY